MENTNIENNVPVAQKGAYTTKQSIRRCVVSFIIRYVIPLVCICIPAIVFAASNEAKGAYSMIFPACFVSIFTYIFSWILMYKIRNHNKGNTFGKVMKHIIRWLWVSDALMFLALIGYYISVVCSFIEKRA